MRGLVREAFVVAAAGILLAGPLTAAALALAPPAWRSPLAVWVMLAVCLMCAAAWRRRRRVRTPRFAQGDRR